MNASGPLDGCAFELKLMLKGQLPRGAANRQNSIGRHADAGQFGDRIFEHADRLPQNDCRHGHYY